jgi:hypothetical protein
VDERIEFLRQWVGRLLLVLAFFAGTIRSDQLTQIRKRWIPRSTSGVVQL